MLRNRVISVSYRLPPLAPPRRVAAVARHRLVPEPRVALVLALYRRQRVAAKAVEHLVVVRVGVAVGARPARVTAGRDREPGVVEHGTAKARIRGSVARVAGGGEARRLVIRVRRLLIASEMTGDAVARRPAVHVVLVARRALLRRVRAQQREELRVVDGRATETGVGRPVARVARRREPGGGVVRVRRLLVSRQVTAGAVARGALVDVVLVARRALLRRVRAQQREELRVVDGRATETGVGRPVARVARRREPGRGVVRVRRLLVVASGDSRRSRARCPCRRCSGDRTHSPATRARPRAGTSSRG